MLLTVDIGNTNITVALIDDAQNVKGTFRMTTKAQRTSDEYGLTIMEFCRLNKVSVDEIEDVIISSVVPKVMHSFNNSIRKYIHKEPIIIGPGIRTGIKAANVQSSLLSIDGTVEKILAAIQDDPKKAPMVRKLMSYYLPTLIKLADYYRKLELQGGEGENIAGSMDRIEENLGQLDLALRKQLDLMYERDALDISTDITVMENMLAREGLTGGLLDMQEATADEEGGITLTLHGEEN